MYTLNYLADVREKKEDAWSQEPHDIPGTEDSTGAGQTDHSRYVIDAPKVWEGSIQFKSYWDCFHAKSLICHEVCHSYFCHARFQSSRASQEVSEEGAFVWHKQSSQNFQLM